MNNEAQADNLNDHDNQPVHDCPTDKLPDLPVSDEQAEQAKGGPTKRVWDYIRGPY